MTWHDPKSEYFAMALVITMVGACLSTMVGGAVYLLVLLAHP
jgi:hypothetical protein